jgi:aspartyl-tRNA(Asn)/glutamyl-tRNA(Gln) amidotransferase subunit A
VLDDARDAEAALMRGELRGPLHGVPITIKDCFDTAGVRTTRGSKLFSDHVPRADATAVTRLKSAGGIVLGKTNLPEFALWWESDNLVFGRTRNPPDQQGALVKRAHFGYIKEAQRRTEPCSSGCCGREDGER